MQALARAPPPANSIKERNSSDRKNSLHRECNHRPPPRPARFLHFFQQLRFQIVRIGHHLASRNLLIRCPVKTKLANAQPAFRSHGRPKRAARHRPSLIEIAQSRLRIEHRTRLLVSKFREPFLRLRTFVKRARFRVPRKPLRQPRRRFPSPLANPRRPLRVRLFESGQPLLQPNRIQLVDGKHAHAALRASRSTRQPLAAAPRSLGQGSVHDPQQRRIPSRQSP